MAGDKVITHFLGRCSLTYWLVTELQKYKISAICVDVGHMSFMLTMKVNKTDTNDARAIANALRGGYVRETTIKSQYHVEVGILLQPRGILVQERTKIQNAIRGLLKAVGIKISTSGFKSFVIEVRKSIEKKSIAVNMAIEALLKAIEALNEEIKGLEERIQQIGRE